MDYFLAELFDLLSTVCIFNIESISSCINSRNLLEYKKVFANKLVINSLLFSWVYQKIFGITPSKRDIVTDSDDYLVIFCNIRKHTFCKHIDMDHVAINNHDFNVYKKSLLNDTELVKKELFIKLRSRIHCNTEVKYDVSKTLFHLFNDMVGPGTIAEFYKNEKEYCTQHQLYTRNPITNLVPQPLFEPGNVTTRIDAGKYIVARDHYFLRTLYRQNVIVAATPLPSYKGICEAFPGIILASPNVLPNPTFIVNAEVYWECIPKLARVCVSTNETSLAIPEVTHQIPEFSIGDKDVYDLFASTSIKEFMRLPINIPCEIIKCMAMMHKSDTNMVPVRQSANALLLIDNRKNALSVLSAKITLSNLRPGNWCIVIVTTSDARPFYEEHFPFATFITHPLQNKSVFNIEDYNIMLKDSYIWNILCNNGIEHVLLVQDDGIILRPGLEDAFLCYDYVGAPWPHSDALKEAGVTNYVGNGGLSLRNVKLMLEITNDPDSCRDMMFNNNLQPLPEDVFFSVEVAKRKGNVPSIEHAKQFASEMILCETSLGIHKPWGYFPLQQIIDIFFKTK